ncbi:MAG: membrane protein insertase YidC [Acidobacteria bacterium]|nr:membrane protein insertase YidC [Acidobacteriota bacterium]
MEKRILIAFVLSAIIFAAWSVIFPPPKPIRPPATETMATPGMVLPLDETAIKVIEPTADTVAKPLIGATSAGEARTLELGNDVMRLEFNTRGAAIEKLYLLGFDNARGETLNLVQTVVHPQRTLPLQMVIDGALDDRVYEVTQETGFLVFTWADGAGRSIVKEYSMEAEGYGLNISVEATGFSGESVLSLGTGMRDTDAVERANRFATWGDVTVATIEDKEEYRREKVKERLSLDASGLRYVGFEDTYFLNVFRVKEGVSRIVVEGLNLKETDKKGEEIELPVLRVDLESVTGLFQGELFAAPKEYELLQKEGGGLEETLHFGIFHPIAVFFLKILRWIYGYVGNWGWAIVLLTVGIRMALFPLMHKSTVSMRRMQKVQPKVKVIQEKYKKNKSDPQVRQKMNQETMALYKEEGVNPVGGCLPMLVQMPILFALYTLFAHAIELRHTPFIWWITDLSTKDPLYITPVLMTATMWLQQRLAPQAGDPNQMRMMRMMPLVFGIMFLGFPAGLVLYWLTNNVVSILQQEVTLHLVGERKRPGSGKRPPKGKK